MVTNLSVNLMCYNKAKFLVENLNSIVNQKFNHGGFEIVVVDDGSIDNTKEVLEKYIANNIERLVKIDGLRKISYLKREKKVSRFMSPVIALNLATLYSEGNVLLFVSGDAIQINQNNFNLMYEPHFFGENGGIGGNSDWIIIGRCFDEFKTVQIDGQIGEEFIAMKDFIPPEIVREWYYKNTMFSIKRKNLIEVGGFDDRFQGWGGEEGDLYQRLFRKGMKWRLEKNAIIIHKHHEKAFLDFALEEGQTKIDVNLDNYQKRIVRVNTDRNWNYSDIPHKIETLYDRKQ